MATSRRRDLPTLRITAQQLEERAADVSRRQYAFHKEREANLTQHRVRNVGEGLRNESLRGNSYVSAPSRTRSYKDMRSQLMPTPPRAASSGNLRNMSLATEGDYLGISRSFRGRGQRRRSSSKPGGHSRSSSMNSDQYTDRRKHQLADGENSALSSQSAEVKGRLGESEEGAGEDMVAVWKRYCTGKIERQIASWSQSGAKSKLSVLLDSVRQFQALSEKLVLTDLETSTKMEVCSRLWKYGHYPVIETFRRMGDEATSDLDQFLQSADQFYTSLLEQLQTTHRFTLADYVSGKVDFPSKTRQRAVMQAVSICQYCYISLGDLSRYSQQLAETPNWGKPRIFYLKARDLAPKDGRPYNQLAVVALKTNRRLDAIYYYMRSLMAKNPFKSAHDSLVGLFEDTTTKARRQKEEEERSKVKAERAAAKRQKRQRRKQGHQDVGSQVEDGGEVWIMPGCEDVGVVEGVANKSDPTKQDSIESITQTEILKKLVSTFLVAHGKLFTKIGIETISSTLSHLNHTLSRHLSHTLTHGDHTRPITTTNTQRLVQMMTINIFSIHHAADSHTDNQTSQHYYCGLSVTMVMKLTTIILQHCMNALEACETTPTQPDSKDPLTDFDRLCINDSQGSKVSPPSSDEPSKSHDSPTVSMVTSDYSATVLLCVDKLSVLLPSVRVWFQWMWQQRDLWREWISQVDKSEMVEFWTDTCSCLNRCLSLLSGLPSLTITAVASGCSWQLWEDRMLSGFLPLGSSLSTQDTLSIADISSLDQEKLREQTLHRLADIGRLCTELSSSTDYGLTFDLSAIKFNIPELVSDLIKGSPSPPPDYPSTDDDSTSVSSDDVIIETSDEESGGDKEEVEVITEASSEIKQLKAQKERLTRKMEEHSQALQTAKNLLEEVAKTEHALRRITPKYLVPDTNCFVDMLGSIKKLVSTTQFVVAVPLVVLTELEGLSKGAGEGLSTSAQAASGSRSAVEFVERMFSEKCGQMKALTSQGSLLASLSFRAEVTDKASNDNLILDSCLKLHSKVDTSDQYSVVLLTDDRNLRVKAHANKLPVKDMPSFMKLLSK